MVMMPSVPPYSLTHDGQLLAFALHPTERLQDANRLGQGQRRPAVVAHRAGGVDQVDQVGDAGDVVQVAAVHRRPHMGAGDQRTDPFGDRVVCGQRDHVTARDQHVAQVALGHLQGPNQDGPLLGREAGLGGDHVPNLFLGDRLALGVTGRRRTAAPAGRWTARAARPGDGWRP